jgi:hypothetical protein
VAAGGSAREQRDRAWRTSEAVEEKTLEGTALMHTNQSPRGGGGAVMAKRIGRRSGEAKVAVITRRIRKEQLRGCAGRGSAAQMCKQRRLSREQGNPEVRRGVVLANQSGSVVSSQGSMTSSSSYSSSIAEQDHKSLRGLPLRPFSTHYNSRQTSSSPTKSRHRRALFITDLVRHGSSLSIRSSLQSRLSQGLP